MPNFCAALASAFSPSECIIRVNPVGAMPTGIAKFSPCTVHSSETSLTLCKVLGRNFKSKYARLAHSSVTTDSAAPSV